jgi:DNA gyrase/topoisomerase IV subunit B
VAETSVYSASEITVLEGLEAVRRRPGMYVGDVRDGSGLHHLLWEIVANSLDEHLAGRASRIRVSLEGNLAEVEDDGRGIPIDTVPGRSIAGREVSALEWILTTLFGGPTRDGHSPHVHVSPSGFGLGLAPVNALCEELEVEIWREGFAWKQRFARGRSLGPLARGARTLRTGTRVRIRPDASIFESPRFDRHLVRQRLEEVALWNPRLTIDFMSQPIREPRGIVAWIDRLALENEVAPPRDIFVTSATRDDVFVEVAAGWSDAAYVDLRSFVGQSQTPEGGHHETHFWRGLVDALALRKPEAFQRPPRASRWRHMLAPGLLAVVHVMLKDPSFAGPTRDRLDSPQAGAAVRAQVAQAFSAHLEAHPELEAMLFERIASRAR